MCVGSCSVFYRAGTKHFTARVELRMNFKADGDKILGHEDNWLGFTRTLDEEGSQPAIYVGEENLPILGDSPDFLYTDLYPWLPTLQE